MVEVIPIMAVVVVLVEDQITGVQVLLEEPEHLDKDLLVDQIMGQLILEEVEVVPEELLKVYLIILVEMD